MTSMSKIFLYTLLLAPIPLGANIPWAWSLYTLLMALIGLVVCVSALVHKMQLTNLSVVKYPFFLVCIPVIWGILQLSTVVPDDWQHPFWQLASEQLPETIQSYISLAPKETATALMKLGSYILIFFLSLQFNRQSEQAILTFKRIAYAGFIYAVYGLIVYWGDFNTLLWFDKWAYKNLVTSTFVNRNSYATYAGLTLLASFPLSFDKIQSNLQYGLTSHYGRQYFVENTLIRGWLPLLLSIIIMTALVLTQSRGGFLSTGVAILAFFIVLIVSRKIKNPMPVILLLVVVTLVSWGLMERSIDNIINRIDGITVETDERLLVYDIVERANVENRWLGVGYGSFENSFNLYRDETIKLHYDKAHNTYLEDIFELGLIPASALFAAIVLLALQCLRGVWVRRKDWIYPALGFAASVLVGVHALVDFSLQIPAVTYTYALIMGAAVAQSLPTRR